MSESSIAICLSGQIRTPNSTLAKIGEEAAALNADLFISVWSKKGSKTFHGAVGPKNIRRIIGIEAARLLPDNWLGRMREVFPTSDRFFQKPQPVTKKELESIFPGAVVEVENDSPEFDLNARDSNSLRMLYKIWRANSLKRQKEEARGFKYERVIRVRPDMLFNGNSIKNLSVNSDSLYVQGHIGDRKDYVNDTIWVSSSESDDTLSSLYRRCKEAQTSGWNGIHRELSDHVKSAGLHPKVAKMVKTGIQDFCSESDQDEITVRDNLLEAIVKLDLDIDRAGGEEFCRLVSLVVHKVMYQIDAAGISKFSDEIFQQLDEIKEKNRNLFFQSVIYLANICLLDHAIPSSDRTEIMFRTLSHYFERKATVFLDVRITELPDLFSDDPVALQRAVLTHAKHPQSLQSEFAQKICEKWDSFRGSSVGEDGVEVRENVVVAILNTPVFVINLHQKLSERQHHQEAYDLAELWTETTPENWRGYDLWAASALALGLVQSAYSIYLSAEKRAEPHTRIQELKGKLLVGIGEYEDAISAFEKSLSLSGCNRNRVTAQLNRVKSIIEQS